VLVDGQEISAADIEHAVAIMYGAVNAILCHKRLKESEIKKLTKIRENLGKWNSLIDMYNKLEDKGAFVTGTTTAKAQGKELSSKELAEISKKLNGTPATVL
jgi:hypothetical protein